MALSSWEYDDDAERSRELARQYGSDYVGLNEFQISSELLRKVPMELMFRYNFVPIEETQDGKLMIAIADPRQLLMIDEIKFLLNRSIVTKVSTLKQISNTLKRIERSQSSRYE